MTAFALYNLDAVTWLQGYPAGSVDLAVTDIAYESLEKHRAHGTTTRLTRQWFPIFPNARVPELFVELYRVLKANTHCYFFCDDDTKWLARPMAEAAGFTYVKTIVWNKVRQGMGYNYSNQCEYILFLAKGKRELRQPNMGNVLDAEPIEGDGDSIFTEPSLRGNALTYPTAKPWKLAERLILQSSVPGSIVLDPFMGSGFVGEAALRNDRMFLGNDISADAVALASARLAQAAADAA